MPFITDDFQNILVDDDEYYQKNGLIADKYKDFVVAQKLYIWLKKPISKDYVSQRFNKYGHIQSTQILESGKEALVTFECDRHACLAYDREKWNGVKVASTWHQEIDYWDYYDDVSEDKNENETEVAGESLTASTVTLLDLNDDCLFALFDHCNHQSLVNLSKTCTRFDNLLGGGIYYFPNVKEFRIELEYRRKTSITLSDTEKILRLMGSHFEKLHFWLVCETETSHSYLEKIVGYYRNNTSIIREMVLAFSFNEDFIKLLMPIFKNIDTLDLTIFDYNDELDDADYADFTELCPNLKKLILCDNFIVEKCLKKSLPTLESFHWLYSWRELLDELETFTFFSTNPQLKNFKCTELNSQDLHEIRVHMPNVENLHLFIREVSSPKDFLQLENFKYLTKVEIKLINCYRNITISNADKLKIIECFNGFKNLLELKIYFAELTKESVQEPEQQPDFGVPRKQSNLQRFHLLNVKLSEAMVTNFVRFTPSLKSLHLHKCEILATESLILELVNVRKSKQQRSKLSLFLDDESRDKIVPLSCAFVQQFLNVEFNCQHDY